MALQRVLFANGSVIEYDDAVATRDDAERLHGDPVLLWVNNDEVDDGEAQGSK